MKRLFTFFLIILVIVSVFSINAGALPSVPANAVMKIGVEYDNNMHFYSKIKNEKSWPYEFGYIDSNRNFVKLYETFSDEYYISIVEDKTFYHDTVKGLIGENSSDGDKLIYNAHLESDNSYSFYWDVKNKVTEFRNKGINCFPAYVNGVFKIRFGNYSSINSASSDKSNMQSKTGLTLSAVGYGGSTVTVYDMKNDRIMYEHSDLKTFAFRTVQKSGDESVIIKYNTHISPSSTRKYRGAFTYERINGGAFKIISVCSMQDYLKGVVPNEMSPSWPLEALKAQAISARNLAVNSYVKSRHSGYDFDMCDTTHCQAYYGCDRESSNTADAVDQTYGQVLTYNDQIAQIYYYASNGGYSESAHNAWGGSDYPYLQPVPDDMEDEYLGEVYKTKWTNTATPSQISESLRKKGYDISGTIKNLSVLQTTNPAGNVYEISVVDGNGKETKIKNTDKVRIALSDYVKSPRFKLIKSAGVYLKSGRKQAAGFSGTSLYALTDKGTNYVDYGNTALKAIDGDKQVKDVSSFDTTYTFDGSGWGHNVGMSQHGAYGRAKAGHTCRQILEYYFKGTKIQTLK